MKQGTSNPSLPLEKGGFEQESGKVIDFNSHILKEILVELKAIKQHQAMITEAEFDGSE